MGQQSDMAARLARIDDTSAATRLTVGTSEATITLASSTGYVVVAYEQVSGGKLYWLPGTSAVTTANGLPLAPGTLFLDVAGGTTLRFIGSAAGQIVTVLEVAG